MQEASKVRWVCMSEPWARGFPTPPSNYATTPEHALTWEVKMDPIREGGLNHSRLLLPPSANPDPPPDRTLLQGRLAPGPASRSTLDHNM